VEEEGSCQLLGEEWFWLQEEVGEFCQQVVEESCQLGEVEGSYQQEEG
jgi:hypothetical protein